MLDHNEGSNNYETQHGALFYAAGKITHTIFAGVESRRLRTLGDGND